MCVFNGGLPNFSKQMCLFVCLLLIMLKLKGEATNTTSLDNYDVFQSSPVSAPKIKYDVFVNFRGEIRDVFLSHLRKEFKSKRIYYFIDDDELPRSEDTQKSLHDAIEKSLISLVIFSKNYSSSRWCLDELVKINECRHKYGQIVLPVFYEVNPSEVRKQTGTYGENFVRHERKYNNLTRVSAWRSALKETADISGYHSSNFLNDADFLDVIVKFVLGRLSHMHQLNAKRLIGIGKQISHVESLLQVHLKDVRAIGLWGMGGIGKTTIAEEVFNRLHLEYEGHHFMLNVREEFARQGVISLKEELFSKLLKEPDLKINTPHGLPDFVKRRLRSTKVLIVLDDVSDPEQLEKLIGPLDWFEAGSRIIITTRDKQVLAKPVEVYQVRPMDFNESFQLFNLNAFEKNHILEMEYYEISKRMVNYAKGIPLVLKVLGQLLRGKKKKIWKTQLKRLKKVPLKKVHAVIVLSYNDLDHNEKKIFLDIACFFDGLHLKVDDINMLIKGPRYSVDVDLESLQNKALITISQDNVVSMHNIIQETAWEIVREESIEDLGNRSRLWDPDDIYQVLKNNKGSKATRSIAINLSIIKELQLNPRVFDKMKRLQYLDIYRKGSHIFLQNQRGLYLPQGLGSLPNELKYLRWTHYPLESLPSKFSGKKLVILNLQNSQVKKVWKEEKDLVNLKLLILSFSSYLVELPDLSKATKLVEIDLRLCVGLTSVHPSIFSLNKLEKLDLGGCTSLTNLQSNIHLSSLRYLSLAGCIYLKEFSLTSKSMVRLNLELSGIKQLPSSIGLQTKLVKLLLAYTYIENLPESIKHLARLRYLDLRYCRELQSLPELPSSLKILDASGCVSLETVTFPPTALQQQMENKIRVSFWNCLKLDEQSLKAIGLNAQINIKKFAHQHMSKLGHDYNAQGTYVYPGSSVPEWMVYRTTRDYMTIDLSFSEQLGFIFCFIVPEVATQGSILRVNISVVGEGEDIQVYLDRPSHGIKSNHVYLIYDQGFSHYLISKVKDQPKFKIKVTAESRTLTSDYVPLVQLRGFGFSPINTSQYINFIQEMEVYGPPNTPNPLLVVFCTFVLPILIELLLYRNLFLLIK